MNGKTTSALIWSVADLLRGNFKQSEYGRVILPFTILRRLDCVLEPAKQAVLGPAPRRGQQCRDGHPLRGTDPQIRRALQRDRR